MGLAACTSEAPATSVVMPEMLATMTEEADPGLCEDLQGTNQVEMDIQIVGDEARIQGCVDPALAAESLTLQYFAYCLGNEDLATCAFPATVDENGYFAGTSTEITATTPIYAAEIRVGDSSVACTVSGVERGEDGSSGTITLDCHVPDPGLGL